MVHSTEDKSRYLLDDPRTCTYNGTEKHVTCDCFENALLIHSFVLIKTWLLIACNTAFYAIISVYVVDKPVPVYLKKDVG